MSIQLSTGIEGRGAILHGGVLPAQIGMVRGQPETATVPRTMPLRIAGARRGEPVLCGTPAETERQRRGPAAAHGRDLLGIQFQGILPGETPPRGPSHRVNASGAGGPSG